jgi:hypothetical protein
MDPTLKRDRGQLTRFLFHAHFLRDRATAFAAKDCHLGERKPEGSRQNEDGNRRGQEPFGWNAMERC